MLEDRIEAAIDWLKIAHGEYKNGLYHETVESIDTALAGLTEARQYVQKVIVEIQNQAERE